MCGICGILKLKGGSGDLTGPLIKMAQEMRHRGPDDEGYVLAGAGRGGVDCYGGDETAKFDGSGSPPRYYPRRHIRETDSTGATVGLGHRRLSILDLSALGHQPMSTSDGRYWIVYNGEAYNYKDVASDLEREGVSFLGRSDTEVLVNAYASWGPEFLSRLNGMFALAIWDDHDKELFCARDRIGIKPFYYYRSDEVFLFASDIKTIIASGIYRPEIGLEGLYHCLSFGVAPRPLTAFEGVRALEQGCWMMVRSDGAPRKRQYWRIPVGSQEPSMSEEEAVALVEKELSESVRKRLVADVDVGTFMSGGIDSTTISAIAAEHHPGVQAFTLGFEDALGDMNEVDQAKATAALYPMKHNIRVVRAERVLEDIASMVRCYEEPFFSLAPNYIISEFVAQRGLKVILNGLGGDELFCGYSRYKSAKRWTTLKRLGWLLRPMARLGPRWERACLLASAKTPDRAHTVLFSRLSDRKKQQLFRDKDVRDFDTVERVRELYVPDGLVFSDIMEAMSYMDIMNYIGNHHLYRVDQFTMHFSIEGRFPFLDHELVEAAFRIPSRLKIKRGTGKYVLRRVAGKRIHPSCLEMKKKGFSLPMRRWMQGKLLPMVNQKMERLEGRGIFSSPELRRTRELFNKRREPYDLLWELVAVELWLEEFFDGAGG